MKIVVKAKPSSKEDRVEKIDENNFIVYVREPPVDGRANNAITKLLADYFGVKPYLVEIVSGSWSKTKIIKINI